MGRAITKKLTICNMGRSGNAFNCNNCGAYVGPVDYSTSIFGQPPKKAILLVNEDESIESEFGFCCESCMSNWLAVEE
jgi:hypothetical protein